MADRDALLIKLEALNTVLDAGVVRVTGGDRTVQYDPAEVRRRRDEIRAEIARIDLLAVGPMVRQIRVYGTRGY